jgi:hypothetical protein
MTETFSNFYSLIINPFKDRNSDEEIDYFQLMGISWALHFIYAFYSVMAVLIGVKTYEMATANQTISQMVYGQFNLTLQKFALISGISEAIFYPIVFHFSYKFWIYLLNFYAEIFNTEDRSEKNSEAVLNAIYASNIFLIFPIFGKLLSFLAQFFYLYRGLLKKLHFNNMQAILVLLTPVFLIFLFAILVVSYFVFLISLI